MILSAFSAFECLSQSHKQVCFLLLLCRRQLSLIQIFFQSTPCLVDIVLPCCQQGGRTCILLTFSLYSFSFLLSHFNRFLTLLTSNAYKCIWFLSLNVKFGRLLFVCSRFHFLLAHLNRLLMQIQLRFNGEIESFLSFFFFSLSLSLSLSVNCLSPPRFNTPPSFLAFTILFYTLPILVCCTFTLYMRSHSIPLSVHCLPFLPIPLLQRWLTRIYLVLCYCCLVIGGKGSSSNNILSCRQIHHGLLAFT